MDWKVAGAAFVSVFLAELGDKTQVMTMTLAAGSRGALPVYMGAAGALLLSTALAVALGGAMGRAFPALLVRRVAGAVLVVMGAWLCLRRGPA
ncbi:MAG: TMEM165/GDT1 family protein [Planctomycetes bacterium]|nr:TMEM165/GDT1 family protein [Planctomycetota bacterium]